MLSRDCWGCPNLHQCERRYQSVAVGERVFCADGTAHLVDQEDQRRKTN
jgi:hypothetical protein